MYLFREAPQTNTGQLKIKRERSEAVTDGK